MDAIRPMFAQRAQRLVQDYERTENPLYLWYAYQHSRAVGLPLDERVLAYLDDCAERLTAIPAGRNIDRQIAQALGFKKDLKALGLKKAGSGTFSGRFQRERDEMYAAVFLVDLRRQGLSEAECRTRLVDQDVNLGQGDKVFNRLRKIARRIEGASNRKASPK